jgi:hypothetical protein
MKSSDGCNERYTELCALSTAGALGETELHELLSHVSHCPQCAQALAEFEAFASAGMAKLVAELADPDELLATTPAWSRAKVKENVLAEAARRAALGSPSDAGRVQPANARRRKWQANLRVSAVAALLLLTAALSYQIGIKQASVRSGGVRSAIDAAPVELRTTQPPLNSPELAALRTERAALQAHLEESNRSIQEFAKRASGEEQQIQDLKHMETSLDETTKWLRDENRTQARELESLSTEKAALQQQLEKTRAQLQNASQDLDKTQRERERALLRVASLETEMGELNARVHSIENTAKEQESFLASDRDIRDLMGARQLYIADVFDVNQDGKNNKAFGRVFYTKGKSLIFYAFDLDRQPGFRAARAFQAWGRADSDRSTPISLGIFYMDNEANRRWVLKSDDPNVLAQISAVFVTVEPNGGSTRPSGKPFLFAYLRSLPPNHP